MSATSRLYAEASGMNTLKGKVHLVNGTWKADYPHAEAPPPQALISHQIQQSTQNGPQTQVSNYRATRGKLERKKKTLSFFQTCSQHIGKKEQI